jgi:hypothetical protein
MQSTRRPGRRLGSWWESIVTGCSGLRSDGVQGVLVGLAGLVHSCSCPALHGTVAWRPGLVKVHLGPSIFRAMRVVSVRCGFGGEARFQRALIESTGFRMGGE